MERWIVWFILNFCAVFRSSNHPNTEMDKSHIRIPTIVFPLSNGQHKTLPADLPSVVARESSLLSSGGGLARSASSLTLSTPPSTCALWSASVSPTARGGSEVEIVPLLVHISESKDKHPLLFLAFDASSCPATWKVGLTCNEHFLCLISARETGSETALFLLIFCSLSLRRLNGLIRSFTETPCVSWENPKPAPARRISFVEGCFEALRLTVIWSLSEILIRKKK